MNYSITLIIVIGFSLLIAAAGLDYLRREFTKKRRDYRMSQALRRGIDQAGTETRTGARVIQWQSCETSSVHCS